MRQKEKLAKASAFFQFTESVPVVCGAKRTVVRGAVIGNVQKWCHDGDVLTVYRESKGTRADK
jgi:hypothetical protein